MTSRKNWSTVVRIALNVDLVIFVLKLALAVFFDVIVVQKQIRFNRRTTISDSDAFSQIAIHFMLIGAFSLTILVLHKLLVTVSQYRNETRIFDSQNLKATGCCCSSCCWLCLGIVHILILIFLIMALWSDMELHGLQRVAISLLFWEILICGFVFMYKLVFYNGADRNDRNFSNFYNY